MKLMNIVFWVPFIGDMVLANQIKKYEQSDKFLFYLNKPDWVKKHAAGQHIGARPDSHFGFDMYTVNTDKASICAYVTIFMNTPHYITKTYDKTLKESEASVVNAKEIFEYLASERLAANK